ncbi:MAG: hypothetical protein ACLP59_20405 [Bryobacteraceae bacterium]
MPKVLIRSVSIAILAMGAAFAQNSDLSLMFGTSAVSTEATSNGQLSGFVTLGGEIDYATQFHTFLGQDFYLDVPVILTGTLSGSVGPNVMSYNHINTFFTPGVRDKFVSFWRLSFYIGIGAGAASFGSYSTTVSGAVVSNSANRVTTWAVSVPSGMEFRASRRLGVRVEFRDIFTRAHLGGISGHDHPLASLGLAFHR